MNHIAIWAFTDRDNDVRLFTKEYAVQPSESQVKRDAYRHYKSLGETTPTFRAWHDALCQTGEVKVLAAPGAEATKK